MVSAQVYGRTSVPGKLRMRNQNINRAVPLDAMPERRTKLFPPRFQPVGRFCELRFRYQPSPTGREGEISRPLDHMLQIPFIHSARFITRSNFHVYSTAFWSFPPYGAFYPVLVRHTLQLRMRCCKNTSCKVQSHKVILCS